jgi:Zn-dependent metalloprotease
MSVMLFLHTLTEKLRPASQFHDAMTMTVTAAAELNGVNSIEQKALREAWSEVGV